MERVVRRVPSSAGFSLVEALIVVAILALVGVPLLALIGTGSREAALSEDFLFAEVLASSFIEEWGSLPFAKLDAMVPRKVVTQADGSLSTSESEKPFKHSLKAPEGFSAELSITRVKEGLLSLEVTISWQVPRERADRKYALLQLKAKPDQSIQGRWKL